jgi:hypothetical protein
VRLRPDVGDARQLEADADRLRARNPRRQCAVEIATAIAEAKAGARRRPPAAAARCLGRTFGPVRWNRDAVAIGAHRAMRATRRGRSSARRRHDHRHRGAASRGRAVRRPAGARRIRRAPGRRRPGSAAAGRTSRPADGPRRGPTAPRGSPASSARRAASFSRRSAARKAESSASCSADGGTGVHVLTLK